MSWKALGKGIAKAAPLLGAVVGSIVPGAGTGAGAAIGGLLASVFGADDPTNPTAIAQAIKADPQAAVKLREIETKHRAELERIAVEAARVDMERLRAVNETMRAEAQSEHWPQYSWRPFNGFLYPIAVILIYFALPLAGAQVPDVPEWIWLGWGAILGVTTWHRGREKRLRAGEAPQSVIGQLASLVSTRG